MMEYGVNSNEIIFILEVFGQLACLNPLVFPTGEGQRYLMATWVTVLMDIFVYPWCSPFSVRVPASSWWSSTE